jgi:hypothetical protein
LKVGSGVKASGELDSEPLEGEDPDPLPQTLSEVEDALSDEDLEPDTFLITESVSSRTIRFI